MNNISLILLLAKKRLIPFIKNPIGILISMFQPLIFLVLFGTIFSSVFSASGFDHTNYVAYILPGILIMNALFGGIYLGMSTLDDMREGIFNRYLIAPKSNLVFITGDLVYIFIFQLIQSLLLVIIGSFMGFKLPSGIVHPIIFLMTPALFSCVIGAISIGIAVLTKKHSTMITVMQFLSFPLIFLSSAFMPSNLLPKWISIISRINPVDWVVRASQSTFKHSLAINYYLLIFLSFFLAVFFCKFTYDVQRKK
ncbi:ABC transporter permease [Pseudogracilibacillus auburnensis]|uniref:ABC transporter permease n=1 Tax=Pseudogracilibacillus auburnensis TaxID=1494959 RepID=UPI001A96F1A5|nr:ABC transporter permease [Pseudogracilibacillus auburnensis]MBO1001110.1 ABC transporter permease [Pseudogracilibacillus auburnensis]